MHYIEYHKYLMSFTEKMPCKKINIQGDPYLERYYYKTVGDYDYWIHRFISGDPDRYFHNHPFDSWSVVLRGRLEEQILHKSVVLDVIRRPEWLLNDVLTTSVEMVFDCLGHPVLKNTWHKIVDVEPNTWTFLKVHRSREKYWYFLPEEGEPICNETSGVDWWKDCQPRGY